jgi:hypothetical protein
MELVVKFNGFLLNWDLFFLFQNKDVFGLDAQLFFRVDGDELLV